MEREQMVEIMKAAQTVIAAADKGLYGPGDREDKKHSEIELLRKSIEPRV